MRIYTVHEPVNRSRDPLERIDQVVFIKEGFAWLAMIAPMLWLIYHRMWLVLVALAGVFFVAGFFVSALAVSEVMSSAVFMALQLAFAFEANDLRRWYMELRGYEVIATISAPDYEAGQLRFFQLWEWERDPKHSAGVTANTNI
jgi:hypothetical protein